MGLIGSDEAARCRHGCLPPTNCSQGSPANARWSIAPRTGRSPNTLQSAGEPYTARMDSWLPTDTFRRGGFGHVVRGHRHVLTLERGLNLVWFGRDGEPSRPYYAASLFAAEPRYPYPCGHTRSWPAHAILAMYGAACRAWPVGPNLEQAGGPTVIPRVFVLSLCLLPVTLAAQGRQSPEALAKALQQRYQGSPRLLRRLRPHLSGRRSPHADDRAGPRAHQEARARCDGSTRAPEKKEFVSDGQKVYSLHSRGQAGHRHDAASRRPGDDACPLPGRQGRHRSRFHRRRTSNRRRPAYDAEAHSQAARTASTSTWSWLVDPATLQIRALTTRDRQGGDSTLTFSNLKENQGISDKEFAFRIPRGVDVITDGNSRN